MARPRLPKAPKAPKGGKKPGKGKGNFLGDWDIDIYDGMQDIPLEELTDWGLVATPGGPTDPHDCTKWPNSPFCGGGFNPFTPTLGTGIDSVEIGIEKNGCEIILTIEWSALGFGMPNINVGWRNPECDPPKPKPNPGAGGGGGGGNGGPPPPELPFPGCLNRLYICRFTGAHRSSMWQSFFGLFYGPVAIEQRETANGPRQFLFCHGLPYRPSLFSTNLKDYDDGFAVSNDPLDEAFFGKPGNIWGITHLIFPRIQTDARGNYWLEPPWTPNAYSTRVEILLDAGANVYSGSPGEWIGNMTYFYLSGFAEVGQDGKFYDGFFQKGKNYFGEIIPMADGPYAGMKQSEHPQWEEYLLRIPVLPLATAKRCVPSSGGGGGTPYPKSRKNMRKDCCNAPDASLRILRRIEAVLQPDKFLKFNKEGKPTKVVGKIPKRLTAPADSDGIVGGALQVAISILGNSVDCDFDTSKYAPVAGYSDALGSLVKMLDRISGFWPATVEIEDIDPNTPGNQSFTLQVHSISDGFKQALEALAQLMIKSATANQPQQPDEDDPTFKILAAILTEVGLTHKIAAITQHTANNIEEFLDYKVRQQEEFLPMAFNPLAEPTWKNLEYTKPTKEQIDFYIKQLLTPSIQDIVVTKNEETKFFTEWMMELLKHSSAASAALTHQIKSKEDLKKALGTARFNALVAGALNMEQIRRVLGLPSNWDLEDFADNLEDNFHPDENVDAGKHAETKPKQAKEKPRIKDISKNGRRRKR
jgi:hypothetical protein